MAKIAVFIIISLGYYLYDIGNLDGVRQGTEALYVQIAKEMTELNSFLVPIYRGEPHWSKPPLQFWMGVFALKLNGGVFSLGVARASMAFFSFFSAIVLSIIIEKFSRIKKLEALIIVLGCFGTLKFSRTFMMEVPLMFLPTLSMYAFYNYLRDKNYKSLVCSIVFGSAAVLVKGQISLVMAFLSMLFFIGLNYLQTKKFDIYFKRSFLYFFSVLFFSSIWFFLCYLEFGKEFFNYFFLRENIGKFNQVNMPHSRILEGLVMFIFPWLFLIPSFFRGLKKFHNLSSFQIFSVSCFLGHYLIWFIPKQKSHHYAIPSLLFFIIFCFDFLKANEKFKLSEKIFGLVSSILLIILSIVCLYFSESSFYIISGALGIIGSIISIKYLNGPNIKKYLIFTCLTFFTLWSVSLPVFFIPLIPSKVVSYIKENGNKEVLLNDRRSFFFEQYLDKEIKVIGAKEVQKSIDENYLVISSKYRLFSELIEDKYIKKKWKKWKRKVRSKDLIKAFKERDLEYLKEDMFLYHK